MTRRVTVSLDDDSAAALETLVEETGGGQSEVVRRALAFYVANFEAANEQPSENLEQYYRMLASGEHVLLDIDFLHAFLEHCYAGGDPDPAFVTAADRVSDYHAREYAARFDAVGDLLEWLAFCGFLDVREEGDGVYHLVFPSEAIRWFMTRFIERSTAELPTEIDLEDGVSKAIVTERPAD
ncbi:CopG domain protein DNA-binding domain protein [Natrinema pellirubrum DSM 15624]|uniref:CopG domain protein DNA-binding domain protein n=1 Tax=Natrinema pellirubrum (strain DSM 15624 / CIP 106293 / JCM 10476 / NCIMB 786 / 157) TaxID=797303 RepID=L0JIN0_NATP1|nr:ribbon-helix-helix protein, CopG family [Natrinema pellirubrum]AGB30191.1 Ribbon-helix-helix protein, copG family [Natrinema pellirubrum DSM 15624]ELY78482.1 CopG domain protein DNA-binding domain protein [Natrinema pellirubrum DSM 15624]